MGTVRKRGGSGEGGFKIRLEFICGTYSKLVAIFQCVLSKDFWVMAKFGKHVTCSEKINNRIQ